MNATTERCPFAATHYGQRSTANGQRSSAALRMHRRCGWMWSPIFSTPASPMHHQGRGYIADASPMHRRCSAIRRPQLLRPHLGGLHFGGALWRTAASTTSTSVSHWAAPLSLCAGASPWLARGCSALVLKRDVRGVPSCCIRWAPEALRLYRGEGPGRIYPLVAAARAR